MNPEKRGFLNRILNKKAIKELIQPPVTGEETIIKIAGARKLTFSMFSLTVAKIALKSKN